MGKALIEEEVLPLAHHTQRAVIEHQLDDGHPIGRPVSGSAAPRRRERRAVTARPAPSDEP